MKRDKTRTKDQQRIRQQRSQIRIKDDNKGTATTNKQIPIIRIRGGANIEVEEEEEEARFGLEDLDEEDALPVGGRMGEPKSPGMIRISGCNPNGIKINQLQCHLQHSKDLQIDIQCYSEVNRNFLRTDVRQQFHEGTKRMDRSSKGTWGTSQLPTSSDSDFKPGGTAIISTGKSAGRVKKSGCDKERKTY
jgi:hypothetical protein